MSKQLLVLLVVWGFALSGAAAEDEKNPLTLQLGSWVCSSPETHQHALDRQQAGDVRIWALQKELKESCLYMDDDNLEDMLAQYVTVL